MISKSQVISRNNLELMKKKIQSIQSQNSKQSNSNWLLYQKGIRWLFIQKIFMKRPKKQIKSILSRNKSTSQDRLIFHSSLNIKVQKKASVQFLQVSKLLKAKDHRVKRQLQRTLSWLTMTSSMKMTREYNRSSLKHKSIKLMK